MSLATIYSNVLAIPFGAAKENGFVPLNWALVEQIRREADANDTVYAALSVLTQTTFRGGISFVFSRAGEEAPVDAHFADHVVPLEWLPPIQRMLKHFVYYGFACVNYVHTSQNTIAPQLLEPSSYTVYFRREPDGGRRYVLYSQRAGAPAQLLEHARFFVMNEPDDTGAPLSQMRAVLPSLVTASELWENLRDADRERAHPPFVYERGAAGAHNAALVPGARPSLDWAVNDARTESVLYTHEVNEAARAEEEEAVEAARAFNTVARRRVYDKARGTLVDTEVPLPWAKHKSVPVGAKLAAPPAPQLLPNFVETQAVLSARIAQAVGVPIALLGDTRGGAMGGATAAGSDVPLGMMRDAVLELQARLAPCIAAMYMDVFRDAHMGDFEAAMLVAQREFATVFSDEQLETLRRHYFVRVVFRSPPALRFEDVQALREARVIGRETAQRLALGAFNLPADLALSLEDERAERDFEARAEADAARLLAEATPAAAGAKPAKRPRVEKK
jgi:hypothetical protein